MKKKLWIYFSRIQELLWFRPFLFCLFSVAVALMAHQADSLDIGHLVPDINKVSIAGLLDTLSASMLVIAIFSVASMLSAFSAASNSATPRSFKIVIKDDVSQNALSVFIGSFIFSIVATVALKNGYYDKTGRFLLFLITLILFAAVILIFLRWVDRISRLGRMEHTISQLEKVVTNSLSAYIRHPHLKAAPANGGFGDGKEVFSASVGYVQHINVERLQGFAEEHGLTIRLHCLPGKFVHKNFVIATFRSDEEIDAAKVSENINQAMHIGHLRVFDDDPRFGLITLSEIASRALSPGINDPGTAIQILGTHERLFFLWANEGKDNTAEEVAFDRIQVPSIDMQDIFEDAFRPVSRDGAANIEVMLRLQKTLTAIHTIDQEDIKEGALRQSKEAFQRADQAIEFKDDLELLKASSLFSKKIALTIGEGANSLAPFNP